MIPLSMITGFLGSGKTTLLKRIAGKNHDRKLVFLVNEFSHADIDGQVLASDIGRLVALPGGSIFCNCLVSEFIRALKAIPDRFAEDGSPVAGVIIEASGIANPKVTARMLRETGLDSVYDLRAVIAVVDPGTFPALLQGLPNIVAQVECCSQVLINKTDLYEEQAIQNAEEEVRRINPSAEITRTAWCEDVPELFRTRGPQLAGGEYALCVDPNYAKASVRIFSPLKPEALRDALQEVGGALYRAKGFIPAPDGVLYFDAAGSEITWRPAPGHKGPCDLAIIVSGSDAEAARTIVDRVRGGGFAAA
jgi:G3E family GTPase